MACCPHCLDAEGFFSRKVARRDLKRYRRKGPIGTTRLLLEALHPQLDGHTSLLDVGGGVGAVQHDLFGRGLERATQVDASHGYLEASREEAERRGHADRVDYRYGDFVEEAPGVEEVDIVTLDRVLCCYPHMPDLVAASAGRARRLYGLVYPRERSITRIMLALGNLWFRLRGRAFRVFLHPPDEIDAQVRRHGLEPTWRGRTFLWHVVTYARS